MSGLRDLRQINRVAAPVREQVVQMLRDAIVAGELVAGQRLIEREVCEATGASRTSVREALRQLESERLITIVPQRGPVVSVLDIDDVASLYETRAALEALVARTCAQRATEAELAAITDAIEALRRAPQTGDPAIQTAAAMELYDALFRGAHNTIVGDLLRLIHVRIATVPTLTQPGRMEQTVAEMVKMAEAVVRRDTEAAEELAMSHVMRGAAFMIEFLQARDQAAGKEAQGA